MSHEHRSPVLHKTALIFALATGSFAIGTTEFAAMGILPEMAKGLGISEVQAGHVISAYALGVVVGAPLIAILGAAIKQRPLLLTLMFLFFITHVGTAFAPHYHAMLIWRFLCGLPHGAYFGVAALVVASLVEPKKRASAVGLVMLGLTIATIIGVPLSRYFAEMTEWHNVFLLVAAIALLAFVLIFCFLPKQFDLGFKSNPKNEMAALKSPLIWLTLAIGAIGFGGLFAVYAYLPSLLLDVTQIPAVYIPLYLAVFGIGMTLGNLIMPPVLGKNPLRGVAFLLLWSTFWLCCYPFVSQQQLLLAIVVCCIGMGGAIGTLLQIRLMDIAGRAQTLSAALNHSAFNTANALGPFLAGLAIDAGFGFSSAGFVGAALAIAGFIVWFITALMPVKKI